MYAKGNTCAESFNKALAAVEIFYIAASACTHSRRVESM